jgi:hypothetical protein
MTQILSQTCRKKKLMSLSPQDVPVEKAVSENAKGPWVRNKGVGLRNWDLFHP